MKKICSLFIAMMLVLNSVAFADAYDYLKASYTSYEAEFEMSMDIDNADALNAIPWIENVRNYVDVDGLIKGLSESKYTGKIKFNTNEDLTKMQASFEMFSNVPIKVNRNLKVTTESVYGIWVDCDITDENAPKLNYIYSSPVLDKYLTVDMISFIEDSGYDIAEYISAIKTIASKETRKEFTDKLIEIMRNNSNAVERGSKGTITITAEQMKELVLQVLDVVKETVRKAYEGSGINQDIDKVFPIDDISEYLEKMQIFADEAVVIEISQSPDGTLKAANERINYDIDIVSIVEATGGTMAMDMPSKFKYSLLESVKYSKVNKGVKVDFPKLTDDNSIGLDEITHSSYYTPDYDWDGDGCWHDEHIYIYPAIIHWSVAMSYIVPLLIL